tara:strand:+ start:1235 stop:1405 length:171 start_codon:yes stop_codon:yes gene_type:complete
VGHRFIKPDEQHMAVSKKLTMNSRLVDIKPKKSISEIVVYTCNPLRGGTGIIKILD